MDLEHVTARTRLTAALSVQLSSQPEAHRPLHTTSYGTQPTAKLWVIVVVDDAETRELIGVREMVPVLLLELAKSIAIHNNYGQSVASRWCQSGGYETVGMDKGT